MSSRKAPSWSTSNRTGNHEYQGVNSGDEPISGDEYGAYLSRIAERLATHAHGFHEFVARIRLGGWMRLPRNSWETIDPYLRSIFESDSGISLLDWTDGSLLALDFALRSHDPHRPRAAAV